MNPFPRPPLDTEERALAAQLPRLSGRTAPDAALDQRILAAAHAAAQTPVMRKSRHRLAPWAIAASLCLALGLAWRVQMSPRPHATDAAVTQQEAVVTATPAPAVASSAAATERPPSTASAAVSPPAAKPSLKTLAPSPVPPPAAHPMAGDAAAADMSALREVAHAPPPPAPPMPTSEHEPPAAAAMAIPIEAARKNEPMAAPAPAGAAMGKAAGTPRLSQQAAIADAPTEDVPPATMASPSARDAWLKRIRELQQQGQLDDARASLAEFRRRYPSAVLPADLRALEPPAASPPAH